MSLGGIISRLQPPFVTDGTDITPRVAGENIDIGTGLLKDNDAVNGVALAEAGDVAPDTVKQSIIGAINETFAALPIAREDPYTPTLGQTVFALSFTPIGAAYFVLDLNGQSREVTVDYTQAGTVLTWLDPVEAGVPLTLTTDDRLIARYWTNG